MTRKDFVLIAAVLRASAPANIQAGDEPLVTLHRVTCANMADALRDANPNFNRATFMAACGVMA